MLIIYIIVIGVYNMDKDKIRIYKLKGVDGMTNKNLKKLDLNKIKEKEPVIISSQDALKDVTPIDWSKNVLLGKKKIIVGYSK